VHYNNTVAFVQAIKAIPAGAELNITYIDHLMPRPSRQRVCFSAKTIGNPSQIVSLVISTPSAADSARAVVSALLLFYVLQ
jgi:hypothetical protein